MRTIQIAALAVFLLGLRALEASSPDWVQRSNTNAAILLKPLARYSPEMASHFGVEGADTNVTALPPDRPDRIMAETTAAIHELELALATERDSRVRQDLQILTNSGHLQIEETRLERKYRLPYFDLPQTMFEGVRSLLDDQVSPQRRSGALVRLRKYAGLEPGTTPLTSQAMAYTRAHFGDRNLIGPFKDNLLKNLGNSPRFMTGIGELFRKYKIDGYQAAFEQLKKQVDEYDTFLRKERDASCDVRFSPAARALPVCAEKVRQ